MLFLVDITSFVNILYLFVAFDDVCDAVHNVYLFVLSLMFYLCYFKHHCEFIMVI